MVGYIYLPHNTLIFYLPCEWCLYTLHSWNPESEKSLPKSSCICKTIQEHGPHRSSEKQFQSIKLTHLCKAMIIPTHWLRERKKCYLLFENWTVLICNNLNPLYSRILCAKIGWNWFKWKCEKIVTTLWNISIRKVFRSDELKSLIVKSFFYQIRHEWNIANISIQFMFPFFNFNLQKVGKWLRKNFNQTPLTVILKMP